MVTKYEIHVNGYELGDNFESNIVDLGFYKDNFIQNSGLTHAPPNHFTFIVNDDPDKSRQVWDKALSVVKKGERFSGYIESETVPMNYRQKYDGGDFNPTVKFPLVKCLNPLELGPGKFKASDIHIERDLKLQKDALDYFLLDNNFYEVHWQGDNEAERIFTFQSEWLGDAKEAYSRLKNYFDQVGGIKQLDLEITTSFFRKPEGFPVAAVVPRGHVVNS